AFLVTFVATKVTGPARPRARRCKSNTNEARYLFKLSWVTYRILSHGKDETVLW
ncbi:hypothetical protein ABIC84_005623, partial [Mucilaginibacter sp. 3215]